MMKAMQLDRSGKPLRHVEREKLRRAREDAEGQRRTAALLSDLERQPAIFCGGEDWKRVTGTNTPPLAQPVQSPAPGPAPAPQAKGGTMAPQTKGMAKGGVAAAPAADPICSNVASLVPRS